jgi:hypothetical protein
MPHRRSRVFLVTLALGSTCISAACALVTPPGHRADVAAPYHERTARVTLQGHPLTLHLASPEASPLRSSNDVVPKPLVLYASGDGGWFGTAVSMFRSIAGAGYPIVGLSSRSFLRLERPHAPGLDQEPLNAARLASDYEAILNDARSDLRLQPDTPVILTGWSRGAAFAVIVATRLTTSTSVDGVVAIGLDEGESLAVEEDANDDDSEEETRSVPGQPRRWPFEPYQLLRGLDLMRVAVIQATHDGYLPAERARELLGPDTQSRRLIPIEARNHRFSGGKEPFQTALVDTLNWVAARRTPHEPGTTPPAPRPQAPN